jgi:hypothetical protein
MQSLGRRPGHGRECLGGGFHQLLRGNNLPADFVSTHHYPTDAFGKPGDDTEAQLSKSTRSILREETRAVRKQAGNCRSIIRSGAPPRIRAIRCTTIPYAAAFIVKTILEANGLVQGYSYWTFSDIFEENYFPSVPFQGGFRAAEHPRHRQARLPGIPIAARVGNRVDADLDGAHETVDAWLVRGDTFRDLMLTNFALPRHPIATESVNVHPPGRHVDRRGVDSAHRSRARQRQAPLGANGQARISQRRDRRRRHLGRHRPVRERTPERCHRRSIELRFSVQIRRRPKTSSRLCQFPST